HVRAGAHGAGDGVGIESAVDLDIDVEAATVDHGAHLGDLRLHRGDVALAAEAGVDGHHEHEVHEVEHVGHGVGGSRRVEGDRRGGARVAHVGERAVQVHGRLRVHDEPLAACLDPSLDEEI